MEEYDSLDESRWPAPDAGAAAGGGVGGGVGGVGGGSGDRPASAGVSGWRKRCLCAVLVLLASVVALNLTLVLWIMRVVHLNTNGVNYIQMVHNGIQLSKKTYVQDTLVADRVFTQAALSLQSASNLTLSATDRAGRASSALLMANGALEITTPSFRVMEGNRPEGQRTEGQRTLFSVDKDAVSITAQTVIIYGEGGTSLEGVLQTPIVSADIRSDLRLESVTGGVQALGIKGLTVESRAGDILATSTDDMTLSTLDGSIKLSSPRVLMPTLRHLKPAESVDGGAAGRQHSRVHRHAHQHAHQHAQHAAHARKHRHRPERIYQLCVCANGQLFLGEADAYCDTGSDNELCR